MNQTDQRRQPNRTPAKPAEDTEAEQPDRHDTRCSDKNLYAWRSPSPRTLRQVPDPVGPGNDHWISSAVAAADLVVAAWGILAHPDRIAVVADLLQHSTVWCLGRTKHGHPRHPLYVPANTPLEVFTAAESPHDWSEWQRVADPQAADLVERACLACGGDEIGVGHADAMELS